MQCISDVPPGQYELCWGCIHGVKTRRLSYTFWFQCKLLLFSLAKLFIFPSVLNWTCFFRICHCHWMSCNRHRLSLSFL
jgi:hypothetical protein